MKICRVSMEAMLRCVRSVFRVWRLSTSGRALCLIAGVALMGAVLNVALLPWFTYSRFSSSAMEKHTNGTEIVIAGRRFKIYRTQPVSQRNNENNKRNVSFSVAVENPLTNGPSVNLGLIDITKRLTKLKGGYDLLRKLGKFHRWRFPKALITDMNNTIWKKPWGKPVDCSKKRYATSTFPKASVIIAFHEHEKLSLVLHTVHSIIQRTPKAILKEIILIDDNTLKDDFKDILRNYVKAIFDPNVVRVFRSRRPLGLIQARNLGAQLATGDVIVCMDSHMEVQEKWLEALLVEIKENPKTLATSMLDWFEFDNSSRSWQYTIGGRDWITFFDWTFAFGFQVAGPTQAKFRGGDMTKPILSPVTVGTIFAIQRKFFFEVGAFDDEMQGWGGENLDLPIRVYLFGGRVVNVPCSTAAHYEGKGYRDYRKGWEPMYYRNYKRVAEVWFDDYKKYLYYYMPQVEEADAGDLSSRLDIKRRAQYDMDWFFREIYPEMAIIDRDSLAWGGILNLATNKCIETYGGYPLSMYPCGMKPNKQNFMWQRNGEIRFSVSILTAASSGSGWIARNDPYVPASNSTLNSHWVHWKGGPVMEWQKKLCLEATVVNELKLTTCDIMSPFQQWEFRNYTAIYRQLWKAKSLAETKLDGPFSHVMMKIIGHIKQRSLENLHKYMFSDLYQTTRNWSNAMVTPGYSSSVKHLPKNQSKKRAKHS